MKFKITSIDEFNGEPLEEMGIDAFNHFMVNFIDNCDCLDVAFLDIEVLLDDIKLEERIKLKDQDVSFDIITFLYKRFKSKPYNEVNSSDKIFYELESLIYKRNGLNPPSALERFFRHEGTVQICGITYDVHTPKSIFLSRAKTLDEANVIISTLHSLSANNLLSLKQYVVHGERNNRIKELYRVDV